MRLIKLLKTNPEIIIFVEERLMLVYRSTLTRKVIQTSQGVEFGLTSEIFFSNSMLKYLVPY